MTKLTARFATVTAVVAGIVLTMAPHADAAVRYIGPHVRY